MSRWRTPLLAVAVLALALVATVDALRGRASSERVDTRLRTARVAAGEAAERLRAAGVAGELLYSDDECVIHRLVLPNLEREPGPPERSCSYTVSPGGMLSIGDEIAEAGGYDAARCRDGRVEWLLAHGTEDERPLVALRGCRPAWRPDGALTFVRAGELRVGGPCARRDGRVEACSRVLLSRTDLRSALARFSWVPARAARIRSVAWIDNRTVAVVVYGRDGDVAGNSLAVFRSRRLVGEPLGPFPTLERLRVSPRGRFVSVVAPSGVLVVDRLVRRLVRHEADALAIAWSPSERWVALARRTEIEIAEHVARRGGEPVRLPYGASDLFWR
jgi:hypothetical protein